MTDDDAPSAPAGGTLRRIGWFVLLWVAGVAGAGLLALPFHWLVVAAKG